MLALAACGNKNADAPPPATTAVSGAGPLAAPAAERMATQAPILEPGKAKITLFAAPAVAAHPQFVVEALLYPGALAFDATGTLHVVASRPVHDFPDASHNDDLIVAIAPDGKSRVLAESGLQGYAETDDHRRSPNYNGFTGLRSGPPGLLLSLRNGAYPVTIDTKGVVSFIPFVIPPSGPAVKSFDDLGAPNLQDRLKWQFSSIQALPDSRVALAVGKPEVWYRIRTGETLEKISKPEDLPLEARLSDKNDGTALGPDGYLYGIEKAKTPQEPDRLVRVGDPGKSSLRADATQVRIADLPVHDVSGDLAFGPQGQLVFSAEAGIYLVRPSN